MTKGVEVGAVCGEDVAICAVEDIGAAGGAPQLNHVNGFHHVAAKASDGTKRIAIKKR